MAELIVNQHNAETLSTSDNTKETNRVKDHRLFSEPFLVKVSQCIKMANTVRAHYGIDILETNGNADITDEIIHRLDSLSSIYFHNTNRNNNNNDMDTSPNASEQQHDEFPRSTSLSNDFHSERPRNDDNEKIVKEKVSTEIHSIAIKLPTIVEMQLRNQRLLKDAINNYRRHERYSNPNKTTKTRPVKSIEEDILIIDAESLCPKKSNDISDSSLPDILSKPKVNLTSILKQIHNQCKNKTNKVAPREYIINEEIIFEYVQNEIKTTNQQKQSQQLRRKKKTKNQKIEILPYENTYGQFYYPNQSISTEKGMIDKIIHGVQAMATALTNTKDAEDVLNGIVMLSDQSTSPFTGESDKKIANELINTIQKPFMTRKQNYTTNLERIHLRMAFNLILADNRLNGTTILCRSESLILSCMFRKIRLCIQTRTLCSYGDVITTINEVDHQQIRLRTMKRMSLSSDEFIEIIGEMYHTSYDSIETMKYYLEAKDVIDIDTNLLHPSTLTSKEIDDMTKYILHEDAIRQLIKLIFDRKRNSDLNNEYVQFKLVLPTKLNELYQPIKKLNAFMSATQIMAAIRRPFLSQLTQRSKMKPITASDLRAVTSQIWLAPEDFDALIAENTITSEILCQFYTDFHEKEDIDERLIKISSKIQAHLNSHSCITRVVLKMIAEHCNGTNLTPFLDEFNKTPRFLSIIDIFDDLLQSGLISTTELLIYSKQDIIIKKSSLLKHFERVSFFHKRDADLLAGISLVIREDDLIAYLTQRAMTMKQAYINCILNTNERRDFLTKNLSQSTKRLSSVSIHQFMHYFNLDPNCGKIFYWMDLTDENIVKTLIETKTFVNEYTLDGIYKNFLTRLHDTIESGIYYISAENVINSGYLTNKQGNTEDLCKLGCYLTYEQASILVDFADPQYEQELLSLITIHDIIPQERIKTFLKSNHFPELSSIILHKQDVIECKTLLNSFHQRIIYRQNRFERITNLQKLLLSSILFDQFIEIIPQLGIEYFTHTELDYLEETKLIDIGVLALLLTLPSYNPLIHQHQYEWFRDTDQQQISDNTSNYLHILDPIIEKYSIFLTTIILRVISNKERFSTINETLLSHPEHYLSTEEVLKICRHEQILSHEDILRLCRETFPLTPTSDINDRPMSSLNSSLDNTQNRSEGQFDSRETAWSISDCYTQNMAMYAHDSVLQKQLEHKIILAIFDYLLHFNHRTIINGQLRQLFQVFKPLAIYTAQVLIEKEIIIIKLLLKTRKQQTTSLIIDDLNRYLESYPIPCRLDIVNELRRCKLISQSLTNNYTMNQCHALKSSSPEIQAIFLFYMMIKLIREEGYIDDLSLRKVFHQTNTEKLNLILREGFLTTEQIIQSIKDFFQQDYLNEDILKKQISEYKTVILEQILTTILQRGELSNTQFEFLLRQNMRRRQVIPMNMLGLQLNAIKISKEKVQRKVDNALSKVDEQTQPYSRTTPKPSRFTFGNLPKHPISIDNEPQSPNLRSLRHHYLQAKIPRHQLHFLVEQGGWHNDIYLQFKRELEIIESDNSLDLIQHITHHISLLLKENGSVGEKPLLKHFQQHKILFRADFELLLIRYGMVALEDLIDLLVVSKLARAEEIQSYAKEIFCLNVNKFMEISKSQEDMLVKKNHVENNLEKKLCITSTDLSQLLNHVLKLDRLKRILDLMPTIKNYIRLHPINTFNAVKALKLEFDLNHDDMKFLRDLKVLNDIWYKQYLLSRISETGLRVSEIVDEEQEQEDRQEFKFRTSTEEEFDLEAFNNLFETKESQSDVSEQRKQAYLGQIKKRKNQIDSYKSTISTDDDDQEFSLNLDDIHQQKQIEKDRPRVIEQFFPETLTLGPQLLLPDQKRLFFELDFAQEQDIDEYYKLSEEKEREQRRDVKRQTKQYRDTIQERESIVLDTEKQEEQPSIWKLPSDEKDVVIEGQPIDIYEDKVKESAEQKPQVEETHETQQTAVQPSTEKRLSEIRKSPESSTEGIPERKSPRIKEDTVHKKEVQFTADKLRTPSIKTLISDKIAESSSFIDERLPLSKSASVILPNTTEDLTTTLIELLKQSTDAEQISLKQNLKRIRLIVDHWLQQTLHHNEQINAIDNYQDDQSLLETESLTNQLITYLHNELNTFDQNFISLILHKQLNNRKLTTLFQQRINHIETILQEKKNHLEIIKQVHQQIADLDQRIHESKIGSEKEEILQKFNRSKEDFNQIKKREYREIQPVLGTRLELAIRTLDADLELIEQTLEAKTPTDLIPSTSLISTKISRLPIQSIESQIHRDITSIRDNLSNIAMEMKTHRTTLRKKKIPEDLLRTDISDRLQAIVQEYSEQKLNEEKIQDLKFNLDKLLELDHQSPEFIDKLKDIHDLLHIQSNQIQKNLSHITTARYQSDHPHIPLNAKLKFLPVDIAGDLIEQPFCLVDEQNLPVSDPLNLIRLPCQSDQFHISNDKHQLTIIDKNKIPLSDSITFKPLTSESVEFEYTNDDQRAVQIIETSSHQLINKPIILNVKPVSFDQSPANQTLFIVDDNDRLLSKPIQLIDQTTTSLNINQLNFATFLYDEKTNQKVLLTPEQYLIATQQGEFTPRKFLTYIIDKDKIPISEPLQISDLEIQIRHSIENIISNKLNFFDKKRDESLNRLASSENKNEFLKDISHEYELINAYIQDRLDKLKTEEKVIEHIVPILDKEHDDISTDQSEYKHEQSKMDYLLNTMKSIVQLDDKLTEYRQRKTTKPLEIQRLENNLIHQLTEIFTHLDDPSITKEVQHLTNHFSHTPLLTELRPIVLSGIKTRAKTIQKNCETLLINIYNKSNQLKQPEQIRLEYIQYLTKRFNEETEHEKKIDNLYEKIERMQYDLHQKMADSSETIEVEELDNAIKHRYDVNQILIPDYFQTKNEKLTYKFNLILRFLDDDFKTIEQYQKEFFTEMNQFIAEPNNHENSYIQQIISLQNEMKIANNEKLLKYIEKLKILLNKLQTIDENNLQYNFLFSKLDRLYEILLHNYQIQLPPKTNIEAIRATLNNVRKKTNKELEELDQIKNDLLRKLDVLRKKEELKQRTKSTSVTEESQLSSLNAYIQQSNIEPINIHHEFYTMKIEEITTDLVSRFQTQTPEEHLSMMNSLSRTLDHVKNYDQSLTELKIDYENKLKSIAEEIAIAREYSMVDSLVREQVEELTRQQKEYIRQQEMIIKIYTVINETFNHLHSFLIPDSERDKSEELFNQLKQRAMDTIIQSAEYQRLSKHVSPHLLLLHRFTSGQELIPSIIASSRNLFQLAIETHIQQEFPPQTFLLQNQSSPDFQKDFTQSISTTDSKTQILQTEINYLQKQHAEAIAIGDFTQQLAAERAISNKLKIIQRFQEKSQQSLKISQTEIPDPTEYDQSKTSVIPPAISEKSLITNSVDQQIRDLLKKHVKLLRKRIRDDKSKLSRHDPKESLDKQMIHSVEDLRDLNNELKKSREEKNRQKQIDIQLQILDKIDQLDKESIDQNTLHNVREQLYEEQKQQQQGLTILSSHKQSHHHSRTQVLPISPRVSESPFMTVQEAKQSGKSLEQTMISATGQLLTQADSIERMHMLPVTTDAKELYQELQEMRYSIDMAFESTQIPSDMIDRKSALQVPTPVKSGVTIEHDGEYTNTIRIPDQSHWRTNSMVEMNSSLFSTDNILDSTSLSFLKPVDITSDHKERSPTLLLVGNAKKYSVTQAKAKDRQIANTTERSIFHSRRDYGEVYVRHRLADIVAPALDKEQEKNEEKRREKIKRKTRLVKFEKTRQGNTVIHRQVGLPTRTFIVPQRANYEENLEPAPPLIQIADATNTTFDGTNTIPFKSKRSSTLLSTFDHENKSSDHQIQRSEVLLPFQSATVLSPIEEESEEMETTDGIAFKLISHDSLTKKRSTDEKDKTFDFLTIDVDEKSSEKLSPPQELSSTSSTITTSQTVQPGEAVQQPKTDDHKRVTIITSSPSSLPNDLSPPSNISQIKESIKPPTTKTLKTTKKKSSKKKQEPIPSNTTEDVQLITITNDESMSTQGFDIEQEIQQPIPTPPEIRVIYHKVGGKLKSVKKKKNKTKKTDASRDRRKKKSNQIAISSQPEQVVLVPRKAVPFISATEDKQIDVEEDAPIKRKKKKRKRSVSAKSNRVSTRSPSSSSSRSPTKRKKKTKRRSKKALTAENKTDNVLIESTSIKNKDAIAMHLIDVQRFTGPPISALAFDQSRSKYDDIIELPNEMIAQSRPNFLKPMLKNFDLENNPHKRQNEIHHIDADDLDKDLFDFNNDTKDIDQPAMFTEYIPDFFQKQAEEKQTRRISLTGIRTDEHLTKHLAPRIPRLYNGWQPSDQPCAHTDEFRPLNKYLMSDISYYFDEDFIDESGLFQNQKDLDKVQPQVKQPTQRFRDDYIVKEFFNCWKDYATEKARIAELRRKRVTIDFREFWFQDALSDPFYSYFEQPPDYAKKQNVHHQMAYRLHKRLVRTGREQPKETMNGINRSSFLPFLFNLPKNALDRQASLTRRRQLINHTNNDHLSNLIIHQDDILPLIRERLNRTKTPTNIHRDELAIKQLLLNSSLLEQGTIQDLDRLINDYYISLEEQETKTSPLSSSNIVKLPMIKQSSRRTLTIVE